MDRTAYPLPALLMLDADTPPTCCLEIVRWIRNESENRALVVIVITDGADCQQAYEKGTGSCVSRTVLIDGSSILEIVLSYWLTFNEPPSPLF